MQRGCRNQQIVGANERTARRETGEYLSMTPGDGERQFLDRQRLEDALDECRSFLSTFLGIGAPNSRQELGCRDNA